MSYCLLHSFTHPGKKSENQDQVAPKTEKPIRQRLGSALVCDGVGGYLGGRLAANLIAEVLGEIRANSDLETALVKELNKTNLIFGEKIKEIPQLQEMGSTFAGVLFNEKQVLFAHCGDSRVVHFRSGNLYQYSVDHSDVMNEVREGLITVEQARLRPDNNYINRYFHFREQGYSTNEITILENPREAFSERDLVIVFTDGVLEAFSMSELTAMVNRHEKLILEGQLGIVDSMIAMMEEIKIGCQERSRDNFSIAICRFSDAPGSNVELKQIYEKIDNDPSLPVFTKFSLKPGALKEELAKGMNSFVFFEDENTRRGNIDELHNKTHRGSSEKSSIKPMLVFSLVVGLIGFVLWRFISVDSDQKKAPLDQVPDNSVPARPEPKVQKEHETASGESSKKIEAFKDDSSLVTPKPELPGNAQQKKSQKDNERNLINKNKKNSISNPKRKKDSLPVKASEPEKIIPNSIPDTKQNRAQNETKLPDTPNEAKSKGDSIKNNLNDSIPKKLQP
jgi:serine/threonine protein phosphatase PrpC